MSSSQPDSERNSLLSPSITMSPSQSERNSLDDYPVAKDADGHLIVFPGSQVPASVTSHVHFKTEEVSAHESHIEVRETSDSVVEVHLGFMQIRHIYQITFPLTHKLGKDITFDPLECLLVKVLSATAIDNGHNLVVEFNAHKEKLMKEKITLRSTTSDEVLFLVFHARVLGKHKGTPSLRLGVHCIRVEPDDEEESDWQGF